MNNRTKIVIALLVLLNIVLMAFLYFGNPNRSNHKSPKEIIIEKLDFDESQIKEYRTLILEDRNIIMSLQKEIRVNKIILYKEFINESEVFKDSIINLIGDNFEEMEQAHIIHFSNIKKICKEEQKEKFNELSTQFHKIFSPHNRRPKKRRN